MTSEQFHALTITDRVWYGPGANRKIYYIDEIVDTGGLRQICVNGIWISNNRAVELADQPGSPVN